MLTVSQSTIGIFDRCRRKWYLAHYRELGKPRDYSSPLTVGGLVHDALEQYYAGAYGDAPIFLEPIAWVKQHAVATIEEHPDFAEAIAADAEMAGIMVAGYMDWLTETGADSDFEHVEPEREIRARLHDGIELIGKLDGKVLSRDHWTGFLEHKTVSNFVDLPATAQINRQLLTYGLLEVLEYLDAHFKAQTTGSVSRDVARAQSTSSVGLRLLPSADQEDGSMDRSSQEPRHGGQQDQEPDRHASGVSLTPSQQGRDEGSVHGRTSRELEQGDDGQGTQTDRGDQAQDVDVAEGPLGSDDTGTASQREREDLALAATRERLISGFPRDGAILNMLRKVKRTARATPPFYERHRVQHNVEELRNHWRHTVAIAREIQTATARLDAGETHQLVAPPTPARDCRFSCVFFDICPLFDDGSDVESVIEFEYEHVDPFERYRADVDA